MLKTQYHLAVELWRDTPQARILSHQILSGEAIDPNNLYANQHTLKVLFEATSEKIPLIKIAQKAFMKHLCKSKKKLTLTPVITLEIVTDNLIDDEKAIKLLIKQQAESGLIHRITLGINAPEQEETQAIEEIQADE